MLWSQFLYPLKYFSLAAVVFLEIGATLDRFISVRTPIKYGEETEKEKTVCKIFTPVGLISLVMALPRGLETQIIMDNTKDNLTITPTSLKTNQTYAEVNFKNFVMS